jgi:hypothetical protein
MLDGDIPMKWFAMLIALAVIVASAAPGELLAQGTPTSPGPVTGIKPDRTIADPAARKAMRDKRAALQKKRADCRTQARQQKVPLLKRRAFIKDCASRS